ncbi:MAG: ASCH domain-containing protein [Rhodospirillaceae bacterium]|nr:ASCH domain-containing protein [Rhodospirillaceae bacterium]
MTETYSGYLPAGCARPSIAALDAFWAKARATVPGLPRDHQVRWIGLDAETTRQIFDLIRAQDKTGTFTLPWIVARTGQAKPMAGDHIILIDFDGTPTLVVRLTAVRDVVFGRVTAADIAIDGSPVRDPAVWKPLHTQYWNSLLSPFGLTVSDDMPFWAEPFELVYDGAAASNVSI